MERDYLEDIMEIMVRANQGGTISPQEKAKLQQALLRFPPSSSTYQKLTQAIGPKEDDGAFSFGPPTLDFLMGGDKTRGPADIKPPQPDFEWEPTLDFLMEQGQGKPNAAEASDIQGEAPVGSGTKVTETGQVTGGPNPWDLAGGSGGFASGLASAMESQATPEMDPFVGMPQGYSFSDKNIDLMSRNPDAYLTNFAETEGGGANMAATLAGPYESFMELARSGALGRPGGESAIGNSLNAGSTLGTANQMALAEDLLREYSQGGKFVDPERIMSEMVTRGASTNWEGMENPETNLPYQPEEITAVTNGAIMSAAPFMGPEGAEWLESILQGMSNEYINRLSSGEFTADYSYPEFLEDEGIGDLLK